MDSNVILSEINDFRTYLHILDVYKKNLILFLSARDTLGLNFEEDFAKLVQLLGVNSFLHKKHGHSYCCVINSGNLIAEKLSVADENTVLTGNTDGLDYDLRSSVYGRDDLSVIKVNNKNYSINLRGLNIVVFDKTEEKLVDSVCFDTHVKGAPVYRKNEKNKILLSSLEYGIRDTKLLMNARFEKLEKKLITEFKKLEMMAWHIMQGDMKDVRLTKKEFFASLPPANGVLRDMQLAGKILLEKFDEVCRKNNIDYWIGSGTLLGAVRHGGFIPWDDDTDVFMLRKDILRLQEAMKDENDFILDEFYAVRNYEPPKMNHNYQLHFVERNTPYCMDIFVFDYAQSNDQEMISKMLSLKKELNNAGLALAKTKNAKRESSKYYSEDFKELFDKYKERSFEILGTPEKGEYLAWSTDNTQDRLSIRLFQPVEDVFPLSEIEFEGHMYFAPYDPEKYASNLFGDIWSLPDDMLAHQHFAMDNDRINVLNEILKKHLNKGV